MFIKLDGETLMGHHRIPPVPGDYDAEVQESILWDNEGRYIYKYVGGALVNLTPTEIENHPVVIENAALSKYQIIIGLISERLALQDLIAHSLPPQAMKDRAQAKLNAVNQEIIDVLGL